MELHIALCILTLSLSWVSAAEPSVTCEAPLSPLNGQVSLLSSGSTVKYACDPGYKLTGPRFANCQGNKWVPDPPTCYPEDDKVPPIPEQPSIKPPPRELFKWDDDNDVKEQDQENKTENVQGDDSQVRFIMYPRQQIVTRVQTVRSGSEIEKEEQKRTTEQKTAPSVLLVRRPVAVSKSDQAILNQYHRAAQYYGYDPYGEVQYVHLPRTVVNNDKGGTQSDEALRYMYWMAAHQYANPRQAALMAQSAAGYPFTVSESQMAWINSLHPELRDRYLRDLYSVRISGVESDARSQEFLRRYQDAHWLYNSAYYMRQPMAITVEDPISAFDYSCYQTEDNGSVTLVRAPSLSNAYIHRYDRRRNPNHPRNDYLAAEYRCRAGYQLLNQRSNELYCSKKAWVGPSPVCVPRV